MDDAVFLPLPKPHEFDVEHDTYKLAIAFDGDRFQTQWLPVAGNLVRSVPLLDVELRRAGGDLTGIKAKMYKFPEVTNHHDELENGGLFQGRMHSMIISCVLCGNKQN